MRTITIGGEKRPAVFTTWTADLFYKMTGINLYDQGQITKVFKRYSDGEEVLPSDFEAIAKLAYCILASAAMPEDAPDDWKPSFTWKGLMNKIPVNDAQIYSDVISVYFDRDIDVVMDSVKDRIEEESKNVEAPTVGQ